MQIVCANQTVDKIWVCPNYTFATRRQPTNARVRLMQQCLTDRAASLANVIEELLPDSFHNTEKYANNRVECDHGRLKARLRPMRGLQTIRTANVVIRGHAFIQNLRRSHYELGVDAHNRHLRIASAFNELTEKI